jgi:hypothetical protein
MRPRRCVFALATALQEGAGLGLFVQSGCVAYPAKIAPSRVPNVRELLCHRVPAPRFLALL